MKNIGVIIAIIVAFLAGYAAGNVVPFSGFALHGKSIEGNAKLEVKLVLDNGQPLTRIEVDVGEKTGPPAKGGIAVTDENGIATFNIRPGNYVIYFNAGSFPKNLDTPKIGPDTTIQVSENAVNQKTIIVKLKRGE